MKKTYIGKSLVVLSVVLMMVGSAVLASAQSPEADVFGVIKINNPQELLPTIAQFVDTFQPGMGSMMINAQMVGSQVFNDPQWTGLDMTGEYTIVVLNPMKYMQSPAAILLPLSSKDDYLAAVSANLTGGEEVDGVYTFTKPTQQNVFMAFAGNTGIMADSQDVIAPIKALLESGSPVLQEAMNVKGQITASLAMKEILTATRPMIDMYKQKMVEMAEGGGEEGNPQTGQILQSEVDMLLGLLDQTQKVHLGIGFEENGLRLAKAVFPVSGSSMEAFIAAQTPKKSSLMGLLPGDSAIIGSGSMTFTPEFIDGYLEFTKAMMSMTPDTGVDVEKVVNMTRQYFEIFGGDFAFGGLGQSEDSLFVQVASITDAAKAKGLVEEYPDMFNTMSGFYKNMGVDMSLNLADKVEAGGGEMFNYNLNMNTEALPDPEAQEIFTTLFGESISLPIGFVGDYVVAGFGKAPRAQVESVMQSLDSGAETAAQITPAQFGLPEDNNLFMFLSVPKILKWVAKIAPEAPPFEIVEGPGIAMAAHFADSHVEGEMFLPTDEILAIYNMIMQAQMQGQPQE